MAFEYTHEEVDAFEKDIRFMHDHLGRSRQTENMERMRRLKSFAERMRSGLGPRTAPPPDRPALTGTPPATPPGKRPG